MNKEYLVDVIIIVAMTGALILAYAMGWLEKYIAFSLIPLLVAYYAGKTVGNKFAGKNKLEKKKRD